MKIRTIQNSLTILKILAVLGLGSVLAIDSAWTHVNASDRESKDETAPIVERTLAFSDFTLTTPAGQPFNLRGYAASRELTLVCFVAGWCKNSNHNGHVIKRLYDKYKDRGLGVVVVMEYSNQRDIQIHINRIGIDYPVVVETDGLSSRKKSLHYKYRHAVGDKREWGTPFYVFINKRDLSGDASGSTPLASHVYTVSGEIAESEAEQFIEGKIGHGEGRRGDTATRGHGDAETRGCGMRDAGTRDTKEEGRVSFSSLLNRRRIPNGKPAYAHQKL